MVSFRRLDCGADEHPNVHGAGRENAEVSSRRSSRPLDRGRGCVALPTVVESWNAVPETTGTTSYAAAYFASVPVMPTLIVRAVIDAPTKAMLCLICVAWMISPAPRENSVAFFAVAAAERSA